MKNNSVYDHSYIEDMADYTLEVLERLILSGAVGMEDLEEGETLACNLQTAILSAVGDDDYKVNGLLAKALVETTPPAYIVAAMRYGSVDEVTVARAQDGDWEAWSSIDKSLRIFGTIDGVKRALKSKEMERLYLIAARWDGIKTDMAV